MRLKSDFLAQSSSLVHTPLSSLVTGQNQRVQFTPGTLTSPQLAQPVFICGMVLLLHYSPRITAHQSNRFQNFNVMRMPQGCGSYFPVGLQPHTYTLCLLKRSSKFYLLRSYFKRYSALTYPSFLLLLPLSEQHYYYDRLQANCSQLIPSDYLFPLQSDYKAPSINRSLSLHL